MWLTIVFLSLVAGAYSSLELAQGATKLAGKGVTTVANISGKVVTGVSSSMNEAFQQSANVAKQVAGDSNTVVQKGTKAAVNGFSSWVTQSVKSFTDLFGNSD